MWDVRIVDASTGLQRTLHTSEHGSQADARKAATEWMEANPNAFAKATVTARMLRRDDNNDTDVFVELTSRPRGVTVTATVEFVQVDGPAKLMLVGDCHH